MRNVAFLFQETNPDSSVAKSAASSLYYRLILAGSLDNIIILSEIALCDAHISHWVSLQLVTPLLTCLTSWTLYKASDCPRCLPKWTLSFLNNQPDALIIQIYSVINSTCFGHLLCLSSAVFYCTVVTGKFHAGLMTASKESHQKLAWNLPVTNVQ